MTLDKTRLRTSVLRHKRVQNSYVDTFHWQVRTTSIPVHRWICMTCTPRTRTYPNTSISVRVLYYVVNRQSTYCNYSDYWITLVLYRAIFGLKSINSHTVCEKYFMNMFQNDLQHAYVEGPWQCFGATKHSCTTVACFVNCRATLKTGCNLPNRAEWSLTLGIGKCLQKVCTLMSWKFIGQVIERLGNFTVCFGQKGVRKERYFTVRNKFSKVSRLEPIAIQALNCQQNKWNFRKRLNCTMKCTNDQY